jgi:hypothetical protein
MYYICMSASAVHIYYISTPAQYLTDQRSGEGCRGLCLRASQVYRQVTAELGFVLGRDIERNVHECLPRYLHRRAFQNRGLLVPDDGAASSDFSSDFSDCSSDCFVDGFV